MFGTLPIATPVHSAAGRVPSRSIGLIAARPTSWRLLRRLLLGIDGAFVCRRRYERAVDRHDLCLRAHRKDRASRSPDFPDSRSRLCRGWDLACGWAVMNGTATLLLGATSARPGDKPSGYDPSRV